MEAWDMYIAFIDPFIHLKLVPPLFLYFLLSVTAAGEVGVTSMLSLEVGVELLPLEMRVTLMSLVVGAGLLSLQSLFKSLPPWRRRRPDKALPRLESI
jgi:hypothetical protein